MRRLLIFLGAALAVLLVAEGLARALAPAMTEPEEWPDAATAVKVAQMDALECADIVFVGNSMARDAFDPSLWADAVAYNAALDAATPEQLARWVPDEVMPRLDPSTVVWALTSPDLNDNAPAGRAAFESYASSIGGRSDVVGQLQQPLFQRLALMKYRETIGDPAAFWGAVDDRISGDDAERTDPAGIPSVLGSDGLGLSRRDLAYTEGNPVVTRFAADQLLADYEISDDQVAAATELIESLQDQGVEVVLVQLPVTEEFVSLHPNGADDWDQYQAALAGIGEETGARLIDLSEGFDESEMFADTHHLNGEGSASVSERLAAELGVEELAVASKCPGDG